VADSGTLEEIERVASQGKLVMLYFSRAKEDPDRIDLDQLAKLREFKEKTFPKALVETYATQIEFRDKLAKQLEIQIRALVAEENKEGDWDTKATPITDIQVCFADTQTGVNLGASLNLETSAIDVQGIEKVPDYGSQPKPAKDSNFVFVAHSAVNKDYYRDSIDYFVRRSFFTPIRFWLKNIGSVGAKDVYVDLHVSSEDTELILSSFSQFNVPTKDWGGVMSFTPQSWNNQSEISSVEPEKRGKQWTTRLELPALQPQREVSPPIAFLIGAVKSGRVIVTARVYADTLPEPITRELTIDLKVQKLSVKGSDILLQLQKDTPNSLQPLTVAAALAGDDNADSK
jgi:hypothetical protein